MDARFPPSSVEDPPCIEINELVDGNIYRTPAPGREGLALRVLR